MPPTKEGPPKWDGFKWASFSELESSSSRPLPSAVQSCQRAPLERSPRIPPPPHAVSAANVASACSLATASGLTFTIAGDIAAFGDFPASNLYRESPSPGSAVPDIPDVFTDARGFGTVSMALPPGTYSLVLHSTPLSPPMAADYALPIQTLIVPGSYKATPGYPLAVDQTPGTAGGLVEAGADGGVFTFGDAPYRGSAAGLRLHAPVVGIATSPIGGGYWLVASDGGIFSYGYGARFYGSTGGLRLNEPVVGMAAAPNGGGYWVVAADGGIFAFGPTAHFYGSTGGEVLNKPVVGMASTPDGRGYWLVASDGGVFTFGDAHFYGSTGGEVLNKPVVGMASTPDGRGYWLVASDGGVFTFGDARFYGSASSDSSLAITWPDGATSPAITVPFSGIAAVQSGGYALAMSNGIGYAAFDTTSLQSPTPFEAFGAMLGTAAAPIVGIARTAG